MNKLLAACAAVVLWTFPATAQLMKYSCTDEQTAPIPGIGATCMIFRGITDENRNLCVTQVDFALAAYGGTGTEPPPFKFRPGFQSCEHKCAAWDGRIVTCKGTLDSYLSWPSMAVDHQDCLWEDCVYTVAPGAQP